MAQIDLKTQTEPGDPNAGYGSYYIDSTDKKPRCKNELGDAMELERINPNFIINGDLDISQRGTTFASIASGSISLDRFKYASGSSAVHTITQDTDVPTFAQSGHNSKYSLKVDCTTSDTSITADDYTNILHNIEGYDYAKLKDKTVTLSFWVKATKTGTYCVTFRNNGSDRSYVTEYTISSSNTWEKKTITVTLNQTGGTENYTTGIGIAVIWNLCCGTTRITTPDTWQNGNYIATVNQVNSCDSTDNNFWLAQVKLEIGKIATPFCTRGNGYTEELALCHRYCFCKNTANARIGHGFATSTTKAAIFVPLPVEMRTSPSVTATGSDWQLSDATTATDATAIADLGSERSTTLASIEVTVSSGLTQFRPMFLIADAGGTRLMIFSAEL